MKDVEGHMNRLFLSIIILFTFLASQSFALVCTSSCLIHSETSVETDHSNMPDCHSSQEEPAPKEDAHSCSITCQTDFLENQYSALERNVSHDWNFAKQPVALQQQFWQQNSDQAMVFWPIEPPLGWTFVSLFLIQQKFLI